jgi:hypothetical protein
LSRKTGCRHVGALRRQCERLGFAPQPNRWTGTVSAPATLAEACVEAIAAEVDNIALYDRLLPGVSDPQVVELISDVAASLMRMAIGARPVML